MKKNDFYIDIVPVLVEEVFKEVGDALQCDVTTHHYMPEKHMRLSHARPSEFIL